MPTVEDPDGRRYVLLKESADASLVRDLLTGERSYKPNEQLQAVEEGDILREAAKSVPQSVRHLFEGIPDERALGLVILLAELGPTSVRRLLEETTYCESDLFAVLRELEAAGLLERRGDDRDLEYVVTDGARDGLDIVRQS